MASSKNATAQPVSPRARRTRNAPANTRVEEFAVEGRRYRWQEGEGVTVPASLRKLGRREQAPTLFTRKVVPQLERRGARGLIFAAAPATGIASNDVRWVAWRAAGDPAPVWGLYLAARKLDAAGEVPANDAFVLIAWGDGPALAWADEHPIARAAVRGALRVPPPWLARGMRSGDATFPVRIDRLGAVADDPAPRSAPCVAVLRPSAQRDPAVNTASRDVLLDIVQSWKRTHGREPFQR